MQTNSETAFWALLTSVVLFALFGCEPTVTAPGKIVGIDDPNGPRPYLWSQDGKAQYNFFIRNDSDNWKYGSAELLARAENEQFSLSFVNISIAPHETIPFRGSVDYSKKIVPESVGGPVVALFDSTADRARMNGNYTIQKIAKELPPEKPSDTSVFENYLKIESSAETDGKDVTWKAKISSDYTEAVDLDVTIKTMAVETKEEKTSSRNISVGAKGKTEFAGEEILSPGFQTVHVEVTVVRVHRRAK